MNKNNLILSAVLALQLVVILGMRLGGDDHVITKPVAVLEGYDGDKVTKIQIFGAPKEKDGPPPESIALEKNGATWGVAGADNFPADQTKVAEFLKKLSKMTYRNTVVTSSKYHDKLEVSEAKYQRKVVLTQDGKDRVFYVGSSPSFKALHVRIDGSDDVLLANEVASSDFSERAWGWVDRAYTKHEASNMWALKIENAKGTIELEKNPVDGTWIAPAIAGPLKKSTIDDLVRKTGQMNLEEPVGKEPKLEYELGKLATVTMVTGTSTVAGVPPPKTETTTILIGKKIEKENRYYVKASTSEYVVEVASWAIDPLVQKAKADLIEEPKKEEPKKSPVPTKAPAPIKPIAPKK
jgi:hypothetical protein